MSRLTVFAVRPFGVVNKNNKTLKKSVYKDGKIELDVSQIPDGQYVVVVKHKNKVESQNLVIKH